MARTITQAQDSEQIKGAGLAGKKEKMLLALEKTMGVVAPACKRLQITRSTHYRWCQEDAAYKEKVEQIKELGLDFATGRMFKRISEGSDTMIMYYLNNHGASRGYGNKPIKTETEEVVVRIIREERKRKE